MSRPLILPSFFQEVDFQSLYKKHGQKKFGLRLLALHYLQEGSPLKEVARIMKKTQRTISLWITAYETGGLEGILSIRSGRGRPSKLSSSQEEDFKKEIAKLNKSLKGGRLRAFEIKQLLEEKFKITYTESGIYALLRRLGYSWITSRSIHPKANLEAQQNFKK